MRNPLHPRALLPFRSRSQVLYRARAGLVGAIVVAALSACDLPFGLGLPTTRSLESGATGTLLAADSFEITGSHRAGSPPPALGERCSSPRRRPIGCYACASNTVLLLTGFTMPTFGSSITTTTSGFRRLLM